MARSAVDDTLHRDVFIPVAGHVLDGELDVPPGARGIVVFAHGSGSSRHSPRNRLVADALRRAGLGTLLFDLLTPEEEVADRLTGAYRFDIALLAARLLAVVRWLDRESPAAAAAIGLFGASTGAAAALAVAAHAPELIAAVVSRGGRADLAGTALERVRAPALLVVGAKDREVLALNRDAVRRLPGRAELRVVPGASHLFEEPGTLEDVARHAAQWFTHWFDGRGRAAG